MDFSGQASSARSGTSRLSDGVLAVRVCRVGGVGMGSSAPLQANWVPIVFGKQLEELAAGILVPLPASPRSELRRAVCLFSLNRNLT